ncbi:metal-dependent transcriptional regulator [Neobacillus sp. DY30]|uniref:metal-dependent transcriptional regulator n=1 Tax=Neobacillus sp. DY30 TaxID=3047871 RepID=UPI0024C01EAE|nr:metal-dependent transcriptional regulator [Neobacillus sp. DY30]WHY00988.1 metal-dependent transcriptional regulator [Neobacillus sp. DY30]
MTSANEEKYLEEIYYSVCKNGYARVSHLAKSLNVSASSVSKMLGKLTQEEFVDYKPYGIITLTEKGLTSGMKLAKNHQILVNLFRYIGMEEEEIDQEVRNIEYYISNKALECIKAFLAERDFTVRQHLK